MLYASASCRNHQRTQWTARISDPTFPAFHLLCRNIVGVALTTEGDCGLEELQHASRGVHPPHAADRYVFNSNENLWINIHDPDEARAQLVALRRSVLKLTGEAPCEYNCCRSLVARQTLAPNRLAICDAETLLVVNRRHLNIGPKVWEFDSRGAGAAPDAQTRAKGLTRA